MNSLLLAFLLFALTGVLDAIAVKADQGVKNWSPGDPLITIINTSPRERFFDVETSTADEVWNYAFHSQSCPGKSRCACIMCITVGAGQTVNFHPGKFIGALTANPPGTRFEFDLFSPTETFYSADMEMGIGDETLGPSDNRKALDGRFAIRGEADPLAKANAAWSSTSRVRKQGLLDSGYLVGDMGRLTSVRLDKYAPVHVAEWFQLDADFHAYMVPGSVKGRTPTPASRRADTESFKVDTKQMTITIHG
ncbi:hypothetical protein MMC07_006226 [Pseudocyphellaria aurata]|nr:hypothetical protein [Pseudocyphellaria aurata]